MPAAPAPLPRPFTGQHAVVTGGGRGIGAAIARALAARGASLTLVGRTMDTLAAERAGIVAAHAVPVSCQAADVTDQAAVAAAFKGAVAANGPVDILVNNAGRGESAPFKRMDLAFLRKMLDINLVSAVLCTQAALEGMVARGAGRVVNVASTAGLVGYRYVAAYVAAKHAVVGLTRALALETAKTGVTVNAVCPSYVETDMTADTVANIVAKTGKSAEEARATLAAANPQGRLIQPDEVASAVCWLCLAESASITGQAIAIAGGEVM